jgi:hypothetical protein
LEIGSWLRWASVYCLVLDDGLGLSDSSDEANVPDEEPKLCAPGSSIKTVRLTGFEAFLLRKGRAGGQGTVSGAQPGSGGTV